MRRKRDAQPDACSTASRHCGNPFAQQFVLIASARVALGSLEERLRILGLRYTFAAAEGLRDLGRDTHRSLRHLKVAANEKRRVIVGKRGCVLGREVVEVLLKEKPLYANAFLAKSSEQVLEQRNLLAA